LETTPPLLVRRVPLSSLVLDPANARAYGERNLESIVASLQRFGQRRGEGRAQEGVGSIVVGRLSFPITSPAKRLPATSVPLSQEFSEARRIVRTWLLACAGRVELRNPIR